MKAPQHIVVFHPAAIGDSMLATPVTAVLKKNFPDTKITYWTHASLKQILLDFCPLVDEFVEYRKETGLLAMISRLKDMNPDLFVDLSNSLRGRIIGYFSGCTTRTYRKQKTDTNQVMHAVDNFVDTINDYCVDKPDIYFPTIYPDEFSLNTFKSLVKVESEKTLVGIVPGVGKLRPHRAWPVERWVALVQSLSDRGDKNYKFVIIGGPDESVLAEELAGKLGALDVTNIAGKVSLPETAAALSKCSFVITGDTGPAHIACAVGTRVIGLYGPTLIARSGPYGYEHFSISKTDLCRCLNSKQCNLKNTAGPGECMDKITVDEVIAVIDKISSA